MIKALYRKLFCKNVNYYGHMISLGYNCEVAFQFFRRYKFVESSLFAWSYAWTLQDTLLALENLDRVGSAGFDAPNPLWQCKNTHVRFHAQQHSAAGNANSVDTAIWAQDLAELAPRVAYLKEKLKRTARDGKKNLYIIKVKSVLPTPAELAIHIQQLAAVLRKLGPNEFDLLVVLEESFLPGLTQKDFGLSNVFLRRVHHFTPEECVTDVKSADAAGWNTIFKEFRPDFKLPRKKQFKFEQTHD